MITPTQVEQEREKNNRMCTRHKGGKKKTVCEMKSENKRSRDAGPERTEVDVERDE